MFAPSFDYVIEEGLPYGLTKFQTKRAMFVDMVLLPTAVDLRSIKGRIMNNILLSVRTCRLYCVFCKLCTRCRFKFNGSRLLSAKRFVKPIMHTKAYDLRACHVLPHTKRCGKVAQCAGFRHLRGNKCYL